MDGLKLARPDTLLGTDSHTPMVGGLGVLGWGVGGIEAQAAMLGRSTLVNVPRVVGMRLSGVSAERCNGDGHRACMLPSSFGVRASSTHLSRYSAMG